MDSFRSDPLDQSPHAGVDGLGYSGRPDGDDVPTSDEGVAGLGFGGRDAPDEYDGDRFSGEPDVESDDTDPVEPDDDAL